jgi:hypothetical protein
MNMATLCVPFVHKPVDRSLQEIRVISIIPEQDGPLKCCLKQVNLQANPTPEYRALSYTWGPPSPVQEIFVNDRPLLVRHNLFNFLQAFRAYLLKLQSRSSDGNEIQWVWIDQICIDQSAIDERNHQVRMMADIYKRASRVYVWLGRFDEIAEAVMEALKRHRRERIYDSYHVHWLERKVSHERIEEQKNNITAATNDRNWTKALTGPALQHFFGNPYWTRLWIVQEIMLAKDILIMCGKTLLPWKDLRHFCTYGQDSLPLDAKQAVPEQVLWLAQHDSSAIRYTYQDLLRAFCTNVCEDPRDKIYGLQGLVREIDKMDEAEIDYTKPVHVVYQHTIKAMLLSRNRTSDNQQKHQHLSFAKRFHFARPWSEIFFETVENTQEEAKALVRFHLVDDIRFVGHQMGIRSSNEKTYQCDQKNILHEISTLWQRLTRLYLRSISGRYGSCHSSCQGEECSYISDSNHQNVSRSEDALSPEDFDSLVIELEEKYKILVETSKLIVEDLLFYPKERETVCNLTVL